jgi:molecular chaperone GrpE
LDLSSEDIKRIKELIKDQDATIEKHEASIELITLQAKQFKEKLIYQMAENDNTVKRYRKQIEDGKQFAISKFAKELLDVRDSLELALQHCNPEKVEKLEDIEQIKEQYRNICKGQEITSELMDKVLSKFEVTQFSPMGDKFDPNIHEAVFVIPQHEEYENNQVGHVMQSGWKIGERVLRAAKVGIVKK